MKNLVKNKKLLAVMLVVLSLSNFSVFSQSESALSLYNKGIACQNDENWYAASQFFIEAVNVNPAFADAWFKLSDCFYRLGEFDLALQYLESAEKYEKNNSEIQNLKGMILLANGKTEEAKKLFLDVLKKYPNDVNSHFGLAEIELYDGKFTGAENQYMEALKRQNTNRKALLSLALVCAQTKRYSQAEAYLRQAMQYYSGEAEVHYLAAIIYLMKNDLKLAEKHARISVELNANYEKSYELLSTVLYLQNRYSEVIDISDFLIGRNRNNGSAWYMKGVSLSKQGNTEDAIDTWITGLTVNPQDELMRAELELKVRENLPLSDAIRPMLADYHNQNAALYNSRYDMSGSTYEYQRALLLDPNNKTARLAYADILNMNGMHELYLQQLNFYKERSGEKKDTTLNDTIEAYNSLLEDTLAKQWKVEPFYLDKSRWNIAIFYEDINKSLIHADSNKIAALSAGDIFTGVAITSVKTQVTPVSGYGEAFRNARDNKFDYFIMVELSEGTDDLTFTSSVYSGRTGTLVSKDSFYATGNNRFSKVLRRFRNSILDKLTVRGKLLARNGKNVLIDLGRSENIVQNAEFKIIKRDCLKIADSGKGLFYKDEDVVGNLTVTKVGEEVSEAVITSHGFYDHININDEVVLVKMPEVQGESGVDTVPNSDDNGNQLVNNNVSGEALVNEIKKAIEHPAILEILRNIF